MPAQQHVEEERRERFLAAAAQLIAERGYHAVRVADIANVCGTSSGAVHYYFPGKDGVLTEALRYAVERAFTRQTEQLRQIDDAYQRLLKLIDMQLPRVGPIHDEWLIWMQFWAETTIRPELRTIHNDFYARWRDAMERIVRRGQQQGVFHDVDAHTVALRLSALTDGAAIQVLTGVPGMTVTAMRTLLVDFVHQELVADTAQATPV